MNAVLEQINSTGKAFVEFAVPMLVQSSALIVILLLVDFVLRKKVKAVFRYCIWMLVLVKLVLPTSLSSPLSLGYWFGDKLAYVAESRTAAAPEAEVVEPALADMLHIIEPVPIEESRLAPAVLPMMPDVEPAAAEAVSPPEVSVTPVTWQGVVFLLWLAVVIALGLLLLQRAMFVRGLVAQAKEANALMNDALEYCCKCMGVKRKVGLKVSANAASPAVCGLFRPVILLPHKLAPSLGSRGLRAVLLHELAHIRRGDLWVNLAQTVLQIAYFYNSLLWFANAMIRRVREQAIDETVLVVMGEKAQQYPQTLVNVAKLAFKRPVLSLRLIGVVESKSALAGRIKHILNRPMPRTAKLGIVGVLAVLIAGAVLLPMAKGSWGQKAPIDKLIKQLQSDNEAVWKPAAEKLKKIGPKVAEQVAGLFRAVPGDIHAIKVLESMATDEHVQEVMVRGLSADPHRTNSNVRHCSLIILSKSGNRGHVKRIIPLLRKDVENGEDYSMAAIALAELGGDDAYNALVENVTKDIPDQMRWMIADHLAGMGRVEAIPHLKDTLKFVDPLHPSAGARIVEAIHKLEGTANDIHPKGVPIGTYTTTLRAIDGGQAGRYLYAFDLEKAHTVYIDSPKRAKKAEETKSRYYQTLLDNEKGDLALESVPTGRLLVYHGTQIAPLKAKTEPPYHYWTDVVKMHQKQIAQLVLDYNKKNAETIAGLSPGLRIHPFEPGDLFAALLPTGQIAVLQTKKITTTPKGVRLTICYLDPLLALVGTARETDRKLPVAVASESQFTATLPNGVTVELVGVCEHPSEGKQWWRPDGSLLQEKPYGTIKGDRVFFGTNERAYEFVVRLAGPTDVGVKWKAVPNGGSRMTSFPHGSDGRLLPDLRVLVTKFHKRTGRTLVRIGVAPKVPDKDVIQDYEWVEFKNVSLRPGHKTDVQVEVGFEVGFEFGPVTEVVATRSDTKPNIFIDIDTGKTYEPAEVWVVGARREKMAWVKEKGIDVAVTIHEGDMCLVGNVESVLRRSFDTDWDKTTAAEVLSNRELLKDKFGFDNIQRFRRQLPATFMFKTRQGGMGLFQIVGFTDDPYGVKVRFKMARRANSRQADVQVEGERPREESQVVWGKAIHGVQVGATVAKRKWRIGGDVLRVNVEVRISDQKKYQESGLNTKMIGHFPFKFEIDGGIPVGDRTRYTTIRTGLLAPLRDSFKTVLYLDDYVWQGIEPSFLNPGRHKIRIYFVGLGPSISSGSVEIEMLPKEKKKLESWPHPWGKAVFGVQVSAYPVKPVWQVGSEPVIRIRLRNQDLLNLPIHLWPNSFALEVDGKRYENNFIFHAWPRPFAPGTEYEYDLKLSKSRPFHDGLRKGNSWPPVGKSPPLLPGKHTVRVLFTEWNMQSEPASNPVEIEIVPAEEKPDVQVEVPWGRAVEGVQMRVRPERQRWYEGETPRFRVDMRNNGTVELELGLTQEHWEVELDGLWYRAGVTFSGWFQTLLFGPGQEHKDIEFYPGVWSRWNINGKPLKFTPGWHTVRLFFGPSTRDRAYWRRLRVVSNAVVIEVLPAEADKRGWGEAVAGLQCGLRADKRLWKADETPRLQAVARNVGRDPWRLPRPSEFFFLKVAGKIWRWKGPGPGEPVELKPGEDLDKTTILLSSEDWVPPYDSDLRLKLSPGKHIVQLVIIVSVPVPPEAVPVTIPVTKQLRVTIPVTKHLRIESNVVVVEVLPTGERPGSVDVEADTSTSLQAELHELWQQRQDLAGAEAFGEKLLEKYTKREEQSLVYYQLAEIYAQSGQISPSKTIEYARAGWWYLHDPVKKARLFVYWGDALQLSKGRRDVARIYLRGLEFCLKFGLPKDKPELPAVSKYTVDGPPEVVEKYRKENEREMVVRRHAERIGELVEHRQALTGQIVQLYAREPDAFDELRALVMRYLHSEDAAEQLVTAAKAYRRNAETAIPVITGAAGRREVKAWPWGEAVEGVQIRLRAKRQTWLEEEEVRFWVDVRNKGTRELELAYRPDHWEVEVDGIWYRATVPRRGDVSSLPFMPGQQYESRPLWLDKAFGWRSESGGLEIKPGRHTVRTALSRGLSQEGRTISLRVVSNPVEIEILPAESGVKVEGEKPTIRVDVITDKPAVVLDLDTGDKMQLLEDWPEEYDVAWDNDGGGAIFSKRGGSVTILPIYGVKDFEDAVRSPFSKTVELGEGDGYGVFAKDSRYVWVKTSEGNIAVVEIQNYSPARAMLKWQIIKQNPDVPVEGEEGWGEVTKGLQVGISIDKKIFALDEPIKVKWQIKNVSQEDKTIIWHKLHYSPVVFDIGKSGEKKYIREDSRRMFNDAMPGPPDKIILKPGETKEATFNLRRFGLDSSAERGTYEVTGLYSPQKASRLADYWLNRPEFKDCFTDQISSAQLKITITDNTVWLQNQLRKGKFWDRLQAARRLVPIIGNKEVLAELEKMYPPGNTRQIVWLVDHMAEFGDTSHVTEVLDMYEVGGYTPFWGDYGGDMLVFLLKWGQDRGVRHLSEYLEAHKETTEGTARHMTKRSFLKALTKGSYWYFDFEIGENTLPLLILTLDEKTIEGSLTVKSGSEVKVHWCDSAALAIQKMLKRDWGFKLNLSEKERDEIITQMQAELTGHVSTLPKAEPRVRFKPIDFPHSGGSSQGLKLVVKPAKSHFKPNEDIVLNFYIHNERSPYKLFCIYPDTDWRWTSWRIHDDFGKWLEMPNRELSEILRPLRKSDFFAIAPGKTVYWQQVIRNEWLPKGGLKPGSYKFFISINKAETMSSSINGYDEFCRQYYLTVYEGKPETGPVSVEIVSGKDPTDETLSDRLERSFYFNPAQVEYEGKPCVSFYIHYGGVESLPKISVENIMMSRHIRSLSIAGIPVEISDFDEDLPISEGRSRTNIYLSGEIKGLDSLKPGKYPVRLVLEGDIYKANDPDKPLEHWQVKLQEEIELTNLILEKGISGAQEDVNSAVQVED